MATVVCGFSRVDVRDVCLCRTSGCRTSGCVGFVGRWLRRMGKCCLMGFMGSGIYCSANIGFYR